MSANLPWSTRTVREARSRLPKDQRWRMDAQMKRIDDEDTLKSTPPGPRPWKRDRQVWRWTIPARYALAYTAAVVLACLALALAVGWAWRQIPWLASSSPSAGIAIALGLFWLIRGMFRTEPTHRERLAWRALNRMGVRTCERCGYDTRGVQTDRCPECGALLTGDASLNAHARNDPETKASAEA